MGYKFILPALSIIWISLSPFPSWADDVKGGAPKIIQTIEVPIEDKATNPKTHISNPSPEGAPKNKAPDPESQAAPAVKIQEGTDAEG